LKTEINNIFNEDVPFQELSHDRQQQLKSIFEKGKNMEIGIKSPLIKKINDVYIRHLTDDVYSRKEEKQKYKYLSNEFFNKFGIEQESISLEEKEKIEKILKKCFDHNENGNIVVSASGMCDEGSVVELLREHLIDENSTIILTGYQAKDTNGYLLKNYSEKKYDVNDLKKIELKNMNMKLSDIKCNIENLSAYYSGHADQEQLVNYILESNNNNTKITILLNHGTEDARKELKKAYNQKDNEKMSILLPEFNKWFNINTEEYDLEIDENDNNIIEFETSQQYKNVNLDELHIYFPIDYDENKIKKIIEYIKKL
jgi:predicted metal-dependent RNase